MNKPITILMDETRRNVSQAINTALTTLPPCIVEQIMINMVNEIRVLSTKQLQEDELAYMNALEEEKKKEKSQEPS